MPWEGVTTVAIELGREGIWGLRQGERIPIGAARTLRNATLEDGTFRTAGGASQLGDAIGSVTIQAAVDDWLSLSTQRTLVMCSDGTLRKDNGAGASWATLASGLTTAGAVPFWALAGAESVGRNRKAFYCDRVNAVQVLSGDGAATAAIANPPEDWSGSNQPGFLVAHRGFLWGGGNANDPHGLYRSTLEDHEDFRSIRYYRPIFPGSGLGERLVAGMSYFGFLVLWKYPEGCFALDTRDDNEVAWQVVQVSEPGCAGPANPIRVGQFILWPSPQGSFYLMAPSDIAGGLPQVVEISAARLGGFFRTEANLSQLATAQGIYYEHKRVAMLACHGQGQTAAKNRRLELDVRELPRGPERWLWADRDRNEALFLRKLSSEIRIPAMGDASGQIWELDRTDRNADGSAYTFEWELWDTDFSQLVRAWAGRRKHSRWIALLSDPRTQSTHAIDVIRDGTTRQTLTFTLRAAAGTLPVTLPYTFESPQLTMTSRRQLNGQWTRMALRGRSTGLNEDVSLVKILIGAELAE